MKIAFVGDIAFFGRFCLKENPNVFEYFRDVKEVMDSCDYVVGNLETPFVSSGKKSGSKSAYISSNPVNVDVLKYLGVNAVNLSNNHIFDFGIDGFNSTLSVLNDNNIEWFGCNDKKLCLDEDEKIVFHGYCSLNTNPLGLKSENKHVGIDHLDAKIAIKNACDFHNKGFFNILSVHSGVEHVNIPSSDDVLFARHLSEKVPYFYYGHHPHVLQGYEQVNESLIAYSLGNFCFDDIYDGRTVEPLVKQSENNKSSAIMIIELVDGKIINHEAIGIYMGESKLEVNVEDNLERYSQLLSLTAPEFENERNKQINTIVKMRNSKRGISWLLNRVNFATIERRYDVYKNKKLYRRLFGDFVSKL